MAEPLPRAVMAALVREMKELQDTPADGIRVLFNEDNLTDICAEVDGPAGTPYEGGVFRMKLVLPADFPASPPKGFFLTKIFHPNVMPGSGDICVNTLKKDWAPTHGLRHVLQVIRCLLIAPFPESALNEEAARMLLHEYDEYSARARMLTGIHAGRRAAAEPAGEAGLVMSNATNTLGGEAAEGPPGGKEGPPLKKLDRKKSLKRL